MPDSIQLFNNLSRERKLLVWDTVFAIIVVFSPFLLYTHLLFDDSPNGFFYFLGFQYQTKFLSLSIFVWYLWSKIIPILLLTVWYYSISEWWKYFILLPLGLLIYTLSAHIVSSIKCGLCEYSALNWLIVSIFISVLILADKYYFTFVRMISSKNTLKDFFIYRSIYSQIMKHRFKVKKEKKSLPPNTYLAKLYLLKEHIRSKVLAKEAYSKKGYYHRLTIVEISIVMVLCSIPVVFFFLINFVPKSEAFSLLGYTIDSHGFSDINVFVWYILLKLTIVIPLIIWFTTSTKWWRFTILSPLTVFSYHLWEVIRNYSQSADEMELIESLLFVLFILSMTLILSDLIGYKAKLSRVYKELCEDFENSLSGSRSINSLRTIELDMHTELGKFLRSEINKEDYIMYLSILKKRLQEL